jgi:hypothetical protein
MLILSKTHDYYDCVSQHGIDKTIIYKRKDSEIEFNSNELNFKIHDVYRDRCSSVLTVRLYYIYFCGKFYPGAKISWSRDSPSLANNYNMKDPVYHCYSMYEYLAIVDLYNNTHNYNQFKILKDSKRTAYVSALRSHKKMNSFFSDEVKISHDLIHKIGTPVGMVGMRIPRPLNSNIKSNNIIFYKDINLKQFEFFRVKDTYIAFSEIAQFISGVLGGNSPPLIEIEDKHRITGRGFDNMSFRKRKVI